MKKLLFSILTISLFSMGSLLSYHAHQRADHSVKTVNTLIGASPQVEVRSISSINVHDLLYGNAKISFGERAEAMRSVCGPGGIGKANCWCCTGGGNGGGIDCICH